MENCKLILGRVMTLSNYILSGGVEDVCPQMRVYHQLRHREDLHVYG